VATYGLGGTPGYLAFTGYSNTLGAGNAANGVTTGQIQVNGIQQGDDRIVKQLRNGGGTIHRHVSCIRYSVRQSVRMRHRLRSRLSGKLVALED